jgi:phosphomethylpyrimidine synthase
MKITQDVREYAASHGFSETEALEKGMEEKAVEFIKKGGEIYTKA